MSEPVLYRVIIPAEDIDVAQRFYSRLLNTPGMRVSPGRHYYRCGPVTLAVYCPNADGDDRIPYANFDHVYFATDELESLHSRAAELQCLSTAIGDGGLPMGKIVKRPWGERSFYAKDPLGNPLCFVDRATLFTGG